MNEQILIADNEQDTAELLRHTFQMDKLMKRCRAICGKDFTRCFISNARHYDCISDMVVNKVWGAREIIMMEIGRNGCTEAGDALVLAVDELDELIVWMKNLRTVRELHCRETEALCKPLRLCPLPWGERAE